MLNAQAPPQGALAGSTPDIRKNPTHEWYVSLQRIRMTTRDALIKSDEQDPSVKAFLTSIRGICDKLLSGGSPQPSIASGLARAVETFAPQAAQMLDMTAMQMLMAQQQPMSMPGQGPPGMTPNPLQGGGGNTNPFAGAGASGPPAPPMAGPAAA